MVTLVSCLKAKLSLTPIFSPSKTQLHPLFFSEYFMLFSPQFRFLVGFGLVERLISQARDSYSIKTALNCVVFFNVEY